MVIYITCLCGQRIVTEKDEATCPKCNKKFTRYFDQLTDNYDWECDE